VFIREIILNKLRQVKYPVNNKDIVSNGLIKSINVIDRNLEVVLWKKSIESDEASSIKEDILSYLTEYNRDYSIHISFEKMPRQMNPLPPALREQATDLFYKLAICSPRGDAQKSLFALNLAAAFARKQFKVGLLDTDLYGAGYSGIYGLEDLPHYTNRDIFMHERFGINLISLQKLLDVRNPGIWRGAPLEQCLQHVLQEVQSENLQILLFDLPPGSGDSLLALMQAVQFDGIILLTRPDEGRSHCLLKSIHLFDELHIPILGFVEDTGTFAYKGETMIPDQINKLGEISLDVVYRETVNQNNPVISGDPELFFSELADKVSLNLYH
jgi:ATP-binding protein involved in chromosome partitioning